ncbi:MAG: SpoIIE family protein phosphatase [Heliobacteriaceae bacterium]|nr:SpoIIE family protein phosphatase [Heliobacteriaceae bacterium]
MFRRQYRQMAVETTRGWGIGKGLAAVLVQAGLLIRFLSRWVILTLQQGWVAVMRWPRVLAGWEISSVTGWFRNGENWLYALVVFLLARGTLLGGLAAGGPAALAVIALRRPRRLTWVLAGAVLGWVSLWWPGPLSPEVWADHSALPPVVQPTAWLAVTAAGLGIAHRLRWQVPALAMLTAVTIWLVEGVAVAWFRPSLYSGLLVGFEGLFAAVLVVVFATAETAVKRPVGRIFTREEKACLMILALMLVLGLPAISLGGLTLAGVVSRVGVLLGAFLLGPGGGAATGVALGLLPALGFFGLPASLALLAVSGLIGGVFRAWGKPGVFAGFLLGHLLLTGYMSDATGINQVLAEAGAAGLIFIFWPPGSLRTLRRRLVARAVPVDNAKEGLVNARLEEMSRLFHQLATTFEQVAESQPVNQEKTWHPLFHAIADRVCRPCASYGLCWERDYQRTQQYLGELLTQIEEKGQVTTQDLTPQLARRCARLGELATTISCLLETVEVDRFWRCRLQESRSLVGAQFRGLAGWLQALVQDLTLKASPHKAEMQVARVLAEKGFQLKSVRSKDRHRWRLFVTGKGCSGEWPCAEQAAPAVAAVLGVPLVVGKSRCYPKKRRGCAFTLGPVRPYVLAVGVAQVCRYGSAVSGDTVSQWEAPGAKAVIALSDGSGVGPRAARESVATLSLLEHFSRAGVVPGEAVRAVNSLVGLATEDESFATVDMAVVDLAAAETELFKLGAAPSYLKRGRRVQVLQRSSLPLGIMKVVEVESLVVSLMPGDRLVLVSDGILDARSREAGEEAAGGNDWLVSFLEQVPADDPQAVADLILSEALQPNREKARDDATVVVIGVMGREAALPQSKLPQ